MTYAASGKMIIARIPVIPDFNDSLEDALEFSKLQRKLVLRKLIYCHSINLDKENTDC